MARLTLLLGNKSMWRKRFVVGTNTEERIIPLINIQQSCILAGNAVNQECI